MTIPETHFFRNPPQIRALRKYVLPELLRQAVRQQAGYGSGAPDARPAKRPYTVAILIRELLPP